MSRLVARDLSVKVKRAKLLDGIDIEVVAGEWLSVIGPNGAGKSTLLRSLAGVARSTGSVEIAGRDIDRIGRRERGRLVAWVPQTPTIPPGISVVDYVLLGRTPHLAPLARESAADLDIVAEVLDSLDLTDLARREIDTLSGGERQRAVIGRALAQQTPIILADEPTAALDLGHRQEMLNLLDRLRRDRGLTVVTTMHDLTLAGLYADRLLLLADGRVASEGAPEQVLTVANIAEHYGADVDVRTSAAGIVITPRLDRIAVDRQVDRGGAQG